jgi:hypothetical protein
LPGVRIVTETAARYELRFATRAITSANFDSATAASGMTTHGRAGSAEVFGLTGLAAGRAVDWIQFRVRVKRSVAAALVVF